jgi:predicted transposase YbfD/YdcC
LTYVRRRASWANLTTVIRIKRQRISGEQSSREMAYFLSSKAAVVSLFLQVIGEHWAIENLLP